MTVLALDLVKFLPDFNLRIKTEIAGGLTALFGPSGAGKSTTLHLIAGLLTPDRGEIRLDSRILYSSTGGVNLPARDRDVGLIFQESRLFPHLTVEENLLVGARAAKSVRRSIPFEQVVEILQLEKFRSRRPMTCSGGERQRIALGRALLAAPKYLLMDEPLAALDIAERWRILSALREVQRQLHLPVLYVSHDPGMVLNFADRMILLRNGAIEGQGDPFNLLRRFVDSGSTSTVENLLRGKVTRKARGFLEVRAGALSLQTPEFPAAIGDILYLQIPAAEIILATQEPHGLSARNVIQGVVTRWKEIDKYILVEIEVASTEKLVAEILPVTVPELKLRTGMEVYAVIKAAGIRRL